MSEKEKANPLYFELLAYVLIGVPVFFEIIGYNSDAIKWYYWIVFLPWGIAAMVTPVVLYEAWKVRFTKWFNDSDKGDVWAVWFVLGGLAILYLILNF